MLNSSVPIKTPYVLTQHDPPALVPFLTRRSGNCIFKTQTFHCVDEPLSNRTPSRSSNSLPTVTTEDSVCRNACRVTTGRLILTLLPLKFYSKWPCWFPVEINFALLLSKPNSHSAASSPSLDRWHQCTSTPNLGNRPWEGEKHILLKKKISFKGFHFQQFLLIIRKYSIKAFHGNKINKQQKKGK